jgi:hypothetical protein
MLHRGAFRRPRLGATWPEYSDRIHRFGSGGIVPLNGRWRPCAVKKREPAIATGLRAALLPPMHADFNMND